PHARGFGRFRPDSPKTVKTVENGWKRRTRGSRFQRVALRVPACSSERASRISASHVSTYYGQWPLAFSRKSGARIAVHCPSRALRAEAYPQALRHRSFHTDQWHCVTTA